MSELRLRCCFPITCKIAFVNRMIVGRPVLVNTRDELILFDELFGSFVHHAVGFQVGAALTVFIDDAYLQKTCFRTVNSRTIFWDWSIQTVIFCFVRIGSHFLLPLGLPAECPLTEFYFGKERKLDHLSSGSQLQCASWSLVVNKLRKSVVCR